MNITNTRLELDKYQKEYVYSPINQNARVLASAGSGKTTCVANRYQYLLSKGIKPEEILLVTYSKKAAKEMSDRIENLVGRLTYAARNQISTVHAFSIRTYNSWIAGQGKTPRKIWEFGDRCKNPQHVAKDLMAEAGVLNYGIEDFDIVNSLLKSSPDTSKDLLRGKGIDPDFWQIWLDYEKYMQDNALIDFPGQLWEMDKLISSNKAFLTITGRKLRKVIIDEGQDAGTQQMRIMTKIASLSSLEVVGDSKQCIYEFNGSCPRILEQDILDIVPDIVTYTLPMNYRSGTKIITDANHIAKMIAPDAVESIPAMDVGGQVTVEGAATLSDQAKIVANEINSNNYNPGDVYVLARTNAQVSMLYDALTDLGIPAYAVGDTSFWDRSRIKLMMSYLSLAEGYYSDEDIIKVINIPSINFKAPFGSSRGAYITSRLIRVDDFRASISNLSLRSADDFIDLYKPPRRAWYAGIRDLKNLLSQLRTAPLEGKIQTIAETMITWGESNGFLEQVETEVEIVKEKYLSSGGIVNMKTNIARLEAKRKAQDRKDVVNIMTVHQSKGLERDVVFLTGMSANYDQKIGSIPHTKTFESKEEDRIVYVGMTRAKTRLYLLYFTEHLGVDYAPNHYIRLLQDKWQNLQTGT